MAFADATKRLGELRNAVTRMPVVVGQKLNISDARDIFDRGRPQHGGVALPTPVAAAVDRLMALSRTADDAVRRTSLRMLVEALGPESDATLIAAAMALPLTTRVALNREIIDRRYRVARRALIDAQRDVDAARVASAQDAENKVLRDALNRALKGVESATRNLKVVSHYRTAFVDGQGIAHDRQFLAVVPSAGFVGGTDRSGRVVEVFGDLQSAKHVLIVVPGVGNRYESFDETRGKTETMMREMEHTYPNEPVAVIEWMGYEVPGWIQCPGVRAATEGAPVLRDFVQSLGLEDDVEVTLLGHSYGSVVASEAIRSGLEVDRLIFTGSPGVRLRSVEETGMANDRVFVMAANGDFVSGVITRLKWHGVDPKSEQFGGIRLATEGAGHKSYFKPGSQSVRNLVHVAMGRLDRVLDATRSAERDDAPQPEAGPELSLSLN